MKSFKLDKIFKIFLKSIFDNNKHVLFPFYVGPFFFCNHHSKRIILSILWKTNKFQNLHLLNISNTEKFGLVFYKDIGLLFCCKVKIMISDKASYITTSFSNFHFCLNVSVYLFWNSSLDPSYSALSWYTASPTVCETSITFSKAYYLMSLYQNLESSHILLWLGNWNSPFLLGQF